MLLTKNFFKIWNLFNKKLKIYFFILLILMLIGTFLEMISISILVPLIGIVASENNKISEIIINYNLNYLSSFLELNKVIYAFFIIYLCKIFFFVFLTHFQNKFVYSFYSYLANRLFKSYVNNNYLFHLQTNSSILIRNLSSEIHQCTIGYTSSFLSFLLEILVILGLSLILFLFQPIKALLSILGVSFLFFILFSLGKKKLSNLAKQRQKFAFINLKIINEALGGIKEVKVSTNEKKITDDFYLNNKKLQRINYLFSFINQMPKLALEFFLISLIVLTFIILKGLNYSFGEIILYFGIMTAVFFRILPSLNRLLVSSFGLNFYKASLDVITAEITDSSLFNQQIFKEQNLKENLIFKDKIEIKNVSFKYPDRDKQIFKDINLTINKGEMIGIIGKTGSGKSTLVDIIIGLLKPTSGTISVDGINIENNLKNWMSKIGYVSQSVFLNDDSIKKNIAFHINEENISIDKINKSIVDSQLEEFVKTSNLGLDLSVGEKGQQISGGQRQRIGIARSLYKNSEILIFDEATNSLDKQTEKDFLDVVNLLKSRKVIIIISHDESLLRNCDSIYKIFDSSILKVTNV